MKRTASEAGLPEEQPQKKALYQTLFADNPNFLFDILFMIAKADRWQCSELLAFTCKRFLHKFCSAYCLDTIVKDVRRRGLLSGDISVCEFPRWVLRSYPWELLTGDSSRADDVNFVNYANCHPYLLSRIASCKPSFFSGGTVARAVYGEKREWAHSDLDCWKPHDKSTESFWTNEPTDTREILGHHDLELGDATEQAVRAIELLEKCQSCRINHWITVENTRNFVNGELEERLESESRLKAYYYEGGKLEHKTFVDACSSAIVTQELTHVRLSHAKVDAIRCKSYQLPHQCIQNFDMTPVMLGYSFPGQVAYATPLGLYTLLTGEALVFGFRRSLYDQTESVSGASTIFAHRVFEHFFQRQATPEGVVLPTHDHKDAAKCSRCRRQANSFDAIAYGEVYVNTSGIERFCKEPGRKTLEQTDNAKTLKLTNTATGKSIRVLKQKYTTHERCTHLGHYQHALVAWIERIRKYANRFENLRFSYVGAQDDVSDFASRHPELPALISKAFAFATSLSGLADVRLELYKLNEQHQ